MQTVISHCRLVPNADANTTPFADQPEQPVLLCLPPSSRCCCLQYVVKTRFVGEAERGVAGAEVVDVGERVVEVAQPGPTCPVGTGGWGQGGKHTKDGGIFGASTSQPDTGCVWSCQLR